MGSSPLRTFSQNWIESVTHHCSGGLRLQMGLTYPSPMGHISMELEASSPQLVQQQAKTGRKNTSQAALWGHG